jgi:hypothetical protein
MLAASRASWTCILRVIPFADPQKDIAVEQTRFAV